MTSGSIFGSKRIHSQTTGCELEAWVNGFKIDPMTAIRAKLKLLTPKAFPNSSPG
jgi:hypothetical protein